MSPQAKQRWDRGWQVLLVFSTAQQAMVPHPGWYRALSITVGALAAGGLVTNRDAGLARRPALIRGVTPDGVDVTAEVHDSPDKPVITRDCER